MTTISSDRLGGTVTTTVLEKFADEDAYRRAVQLAGGQWNPVPLVSRVERPTIERGLFRADIGKLMRGAEDTTDGHALSGMMLADEVLVVRGNILLNLGSAQFWRRLTGMEAQDELFDNTHTRIGVGNSNAAAARTQVDLQGAQKSFAGMEAGYPVITPGDAAGGAILTVRAVFSGANGNHDHLEWVIDNRNGAPAGAIVLNRFVQNFGLKAVGAVWIYTFAAQLG